MKVVNTTNNCKLTVLRNGRRIEEEKYVNDITLENTEVLSSVKNNESTNYTYGYTRLTASTEDTITVYVQNSYRDVVLEVENNSKKNLRKFICKQKLVI